MWYLRRSRCSMSYGIGISMENPKLGSAGPCPLEWGRVWHFSHTGCHAKSNGWRSSGTTYIGKSPKTRFLASRLPPFKVTLGHRNWHRSIGYLSVHINVPQQQWTSLAPYATHSEILAKIANFWNPPSSIWHRTRKSRVVTSPVAAFFFFGGGGSGF